MDYFLKENKKYLIALGAGLVFWYLFGWLVIGPREAAANKAARDRNNEEKAYAELIRNGAPTKATILAAQNDLEKSKRLLESLQADLVFKEDAAFDDVAVYPHAAQPDRYKRRPGDDAETHYSDVKIKLYEDLKKMAVNEQILFPPSFGLEPAGDRPGERLAENLLRRLALVERVCGLAIKAKVDAIEAIDGLYKLNLDRFEIDPDQPLPKKFLERDSIQFRFAGSPESVFRVLHGVQRPGAYLAVSEFGADRSDPTKESLKVNLVVSLLSVEPEISVDPRAKEE